MTTLAEHLDASIEEPQTEEERESFSIRDEGAANWALRKLARIRAEQEKNADLARLEIERVNAWLDEVNLQLGARAEFFEGHLIDYHRGLLAEDEKRKTVKLPAGTLSARKVPDNVEIADDFLERAIDLFPEFIRTKKELDKRAVKEAVLNDGQILPGVTRIEGSINFSIKTEPSAH